MKSFEELYNEFENDQMIKSKAVEVKNERQRRNKISLLLCVLIDIIIIAIVYKLISFDAVKLIFYIIPVLTANLIIIIIVSFSNTKKKEFILIFKENIIKKIINNWFTDVEYFPNKQMPEKIYEEGSYEEYDNYYSDDYIEAKIDGKYFIDIAEIETEEEREEKNSDGDTETETCTIFSGIFAKIIMEKNINSNLRIDSSYSGYKNKLEMDSSEFEKQFDVFASDKIIGMQILTADIMEEILEFKNIIKEDFDIYINEKNIYLRFHCGSMFEPIIRKKQILDKKSLNLYYDILKFTYELSNKIIKTIEEAEI